LFFFNHYACEHFQDNSRRNEEKPINFVELQLRTTKNSPPHFLMDWFAGGLNYQIEHHLFPTLPRHNLFKVSHLVKEFCEKNKLPYQSCGFFSRYCRSSQTIIFGCSISFCLFLKFIFFIRKIPFF